MDYQEQYGDLYNLEATPAESTTYRLGQARRGTVPDIITAKNNGTPLLHQLLPPAGGLHRGHLRGPGHPGRAADPVHLRHCVPRLPGEKLPDWKAAATLVRKIAENFKLPYYTMSPTYSICRTTAISRASTLPAPSAGRPARCRAASPAITARSRTGTTARSRSSRTGRSTRWKTPGWRAAASATGMLRRSPQPAPRPAHRRRGRGRPVPLHHQDLPQLQHRQAGAGEGGHRLSGDGRERASGAGGPVRYPAGPPP